MKNSVHRRLLIVLLVAVLPGLAACVDHSHHDHDAETHAADAEGPPPAEDGAADGPPSSYTVGGLTLTALRDSPTYPGATLSLAGYDAGGDVSAGEATMSFEATGFELGAQTADAGGKGIANSVQGQHIHLIVDNGPYSAHYEPTATASLEPGHHVVLAFLSRSYHESVKASGASVVTHFTVGGEGDPAAFDASAPHLFYSRPKGQYVGADIERLMLDFYLVNAELSATGYHVRATIAGNQFTLTEWVPWVIEGLSPGEIEIRLELLDVEGNPVPGPFNDVTRTVTLVTAEEEPAED